MSEQQAKAGGGCNEVNSAQRNSQNNEDRFASFQVTGGDAPRGSRGGRGRGGRGRDGADGDEQTPFEHRGGRGRGGRGRGGLDGEELAPFENRGGRGRGGRGRGDADGDEPFEHRGGRGRGGRGRGGAEGDAPFEHRGGRGGGRGRGGAEGDAPFEHRGGRGGGRGRGGVDPAYDRSAIDSNPDGPVQQNDQEPAAAATPVEEASARFVARGRGGGGGRGGGPESDPTLTRPGRRQRAPRLRFNNFEDKDIEELFTQRHNQTGISFDNYECIQVDIIPTDIAPVASFEGLDIDPHLEANLNRCGYKKPTPVQKFGVPVALSGNDLMACAQTGSGKTAAFLIPLVQHILKFGVSPQQNRVSYPVGLVLAPIRELALQIYDETRKMCFKTDIFVDVAYGGTGYAHNFEQDILVACPGRLKDLFDRERISFANIKFLILDEADRMLEMGFEEQIKYLCGSRFSDMPPPEERQTLMFSATFPPAIRELAQSYLRKRYYLLTVGRVGSTTTNITQSIEWVEKDDKRGRLLDIICEHVQTDLILVFVETKAEADELFYYLDDEGIPASIIHGGLDQKQREASLKDFKNAVTPILVATDVASRGLDIPNVTHVVQYDLPTSMDDYTHRIGRTGRAGNKGTATSFFNKRNYAIIDDLLKYVSEHGQVVPQWMEDARDDHNARNFGGGGRGAGGRGGKRGGRGGRGGGNDNDADLRWDEEAGSGGGAKGGRGGGGGKGGDRKDAPSKPKVTPSRVSQFDDGGF